MRKKSELRAGAALALVLSLALGGCGEPTRDDAAGDPLPASSRPSPQDPVAYTPGSSVAPPVRGPRRVTPIPGQADVHPIPFAQATVHEGTLDITFYSGVEPCHVLDRVEVEYGIETIIVTLMEGHTEMDEPVACIELAEYKRVTVELDEAVRGRRIVDGAR